MSKVELAMGPFKRNAEYDSAMHVTSQMFNTRYHEVTKQYCVFQSYLQYSQRDALYLERKE